jgi:hypothetical protein
VDLSCHTSCHHVFSHQLSCVAFPSLFLPQFLSFSSPSITRSSLKVSPTTLDSRLIYLITSLLRAF